VADLAKVAQARLRAARKEARARSGGGAAAAAPQASGLESLLSRLVRSQERIAFLMEAQDPRAAARPQRPAVMSGMRRRRSWRRS
jgi:hypothetical protein